MNRPLKIWKVTSTFGLRKNPINGIHEFHNGIDLACKIGTEIHSPEDGKVIMIIDNEYGGLQLKIQHKDYISGYAHLSKVNVKIGDVVSQGQVVALTGNSGASTGPHLHHTIRKASNNELIDPQLVYIDKN